jgi:hypothetical protein
LRPIVDSQLEPRWSSEGVSVRTRDIVARYYSEAMPIFDGKILFWYVRNILLYEQALDENSNVMLCKYEDIVSEPARVMQRIYSFLGYDYPGDHVVADIHSHSANLGKFIDLHPEIEGLCIDLLHRLDQTRLAARY